MSGTELFAPDLWMPHLKSIRIAPIGGTLTCGGLLLTILLVNHTRLGLTLRAIGNNIKAALLFGLNPGVYMMTALVFAGGFAGLAGSIQVAAVYYRLIPAISSNYGYLAILVVMLAGRAPNALGKPYNPQIRL